MSVAESMTTTSDEQVLYAVGDDGVATITLNRPDRLNSITPSGADLLGSLLARAEVDSSVRCVLLRGHGRSFCAGGDVDALKKRDSADQADDTSEIERYAELVEIARARHTNLPLRMHRFPKPTIAVLHGHTYGVGLSLALTCDLRIAASSTRFNTMFMKVGRSGDFGVTYTLPRLVGRAKARELLFTSQTIGADEALRIGLVNHVHADDAVQDAGQEMAALIADGPREALVRMKQNLALAEEASLPVVLDQEAANQTLCGQSEEGRRYFLRWVDRFRSAESADRGGS